MKNTAILIYCDGACSGNPGPGGWGSIITTPDGQVREMGGSLGRTTNNQMELLAATEALRVLVARAGSEDIIIYTDSVYVIRGITQWIWGWIKRGWKTAEGGDVSNREYWQALLEVVSVLKKSHALSWKYVRGHVGIVGNERCDEIAVAYSKAMPIRLFQGSVHEYELPIETPPPEEELPDPANRAKGPKPAAFSYLSYVGGTALRHKTWSDCERRVKGQAGAKFKKSSSPASEVEILKSWGVNPSNVKDS